MTMPAGKYYIGDLCYVMHPEWDEFCGVTIKGNECLEGEFNLKDGRRFATFSTKWGDGEYKDQNGYRYGVDAGLIGCIRVEDIQDPSFDEEDPPGRIVEFASDFYVRGGRSDQGRDWDGVIQIGHIYIDTDGEEDENEVDCDYDYEE